jgi:capsular polysaccharide biosynthesis protein
MGQISRVKDDDRYITIVNEWSNNYFHWFTEAVPKLYCFLNNGEKPIILLPSNHALPFQKRSLEILGFSYKYFSGKGLVCNNVYLPFRLAPSSAQYNPTVLKQIVSKLKSGVVLDINKGERIYVTRAKAQKRKIINESEVLLIMKALGFVVIYFEDYNLDEQISIMHHTKILVSMHGAGLTNIMFCNSGVSVFELILKNQIMDKCYFNLSNAMDLKYYYQFCESDNDLNDYHSADIFVDLNELEENLQKIISKIYV